MMLKENKPAYLLAKNIAIKGGTTEAGLQVFNNKKILQKTFNKVIKAAYMKANKLGN